MLRLHADTRRALAVRRGDGYLLSALLLYRDGGAGGVGQFHLVSKHVLVEALQRVAVQVNHLQKSVLRLLHHKGDGVGPLVAAGSGYGQRIDIAFGNCQHFLLRVAFVVGNLRNLALAGGKRVHILQGVRMEAP